MGFTIDRSFAFSNPFPGGGNRSVNDGLYRGGAKGGVYEKCPYRKAPANKKLNAYGNRLKSPAGGFVGVNGRFPFTPSEIEHPLYKPNATSRLLGGPNKASPHLGNRPPHQLVI